MARAVSSGGEHYLDTVGVTSSNLVPPTISSSVVGCSHCLRSQKKGPCEPQRIRVRCSTLCGHGSAGRAPPCQGGGRGFEPRCPLHRLQEPAHRDSMGRLFFQGRKLFGATWPSGKAEACKAFISGSNPDVASNLSPSPPCRSHFPRHRSFWRAMCSESPHRAMSGRSMPPDRHLDLLC